MLLIVRVISLQDLLIKIILEILQWIQTVERIIHQVVTAEWTFELYKTYETLNQNNQWKQIFICSTRMIELEYKASRRYFTWVNNIWADFLIEGTWIEWWSIDLIWSMAWKNTPRRFDTDNLIGIGHLKWHLIDMINDLNLNNLFKFQLL